LRTRERQTGRTVDIVSVKRDYRTKALGSKAHLHGNCFAGGRAAPRRCQAIVRVGSQRCRGAGKPPNGRGSRSRRPV
jgi:hypothetical protein